MEVVHPGQSWKVVAARHATPTRSRRMDVHQNAKNTPHGRRLMVQRLAEGWTYARPWRRRSASIPRPCANGAIGSSPRGQPAWPTARPGRIVARPGWARPRRARSWRCAASACPAPPSPAGSAARSRPWAWSCAAAASAGSAPSTPARSSIRYQRERPGELIHVDIKKLGRIDGIGHRITGDRTQSRRAASAGTSSTSASTMPPALPTPRSCPTSGRRAPSPSSSAPSPGSPAWASPSSGS